MYEIVITAVNYNSKDDFLEFPRLAPSFRQFFFAVKEFSYANISLIITSQFYELAEIKT